MSGGETRGGGGGEAFKTVFRLLIFIIRYIYQLIVAILDCT